MHSSRFQKHPLSLLVSTILTLLPGTLLLTPASVHAADQAASQATNRQHSLNIPAANLTTALNQLGQQSGLVLMYSPTLTQGHSTAGIQGNMTITEALDRLLDGTGLAYTLMDNRVTLTKAATDAGPITLPSITVRGERVTRSLHETASSVDVLNAESIQQHTSITSGNDLNAMISNQVGTETSNYAPAVRGVDGTCGMSNRLKSIEAHKAR